ncbi:Inactive phospholipase D5 [Triplophysa tibetana]|uniref:Inactive phospholipase D5 n=1 Tax=Triplophysa tibetana TaxID=1572043 RepID=A0A5A9P6Y9_9TELE|nr:Inactive phospholipase D5 [Triplophysa tibetana]
MKVIITISSQKGSPDVFFPKERMKDIEAIFRVIQEANTFIYISVPNYLPILKRTQPKYWAQIDNMLREALILKKNIKVCMLVSCWEQTDPLTFNFLWSLQSLCMDSINCSLEAKFFIQREQSGKRLYGINRNRYMVTDNSVYLGNFDWVANEFVFNAGVGIVINQQNKMNSTVVEMMKAVFERDWNSQYTLLVTLVANPVNTLLVYDRKTLLDQRIFAKIWSTLIIMVKELCLLTIGHPDIPPPRNSATPVTKTAPPPG